MKYTIEITPERYSSGVWTEVTDQALSLDLPINDAESQLRVDELLRIPSEAKVSEEDMKAYIQTAKEIFNQAPNSPTSADSFFDMLDRMETLDLSSQCNHSCVHCYISDNPAYYTPLSKVKSHIQTLPKGYYRAVSLFGGEPTMYPHVLEVMEYALDHGLTTHLNTNGHRLGNVPFFDRLVNAGLSAVTMSLHTHDLDHFDRIAQSPGAGKEVWRALRNLHERSIITMTQTVLTRDLMPEALTTLDMIQQVAPGARMFLSASYPHGYANSLKVTPAHQEMERYLQPILEKWGHLITTIDIPMCYLHPYQDVVLNRDEAVKKGDHKQEHIKLLECAECKYDERCIGMLEKYGELYDYMPKPILGADQKKTSLTPPDHWRRDEIEQLKEFSCTAQFQITGECQLHCEHCLLGHVSGDTLPFEQLKQIIDEIDINQYKVLNLSGFEATLHPQLPNIIKYAKQKGLLVYLPTNGIRFEQPFYVEEVAEAGLDAALITLHSSQEDIFDNVTNTHGYYGQAWKGAQHLYNSPVNLILGIVLTSTTAPTVYATVETMRREFPESFISITNCIPQGLGYNPSLMLSPRDLKQVLSPVLSKWGEWLIVDGLPLCTLFPYQDDVIRYEDFTTETETLLDSANGVTCYLNFVKTPTCATCALEDSCPGINSFFIDYDGYDTPPAVNPSTDRRELLEAMSRTLRPGQHPTLSLSRKERTHRLSQLLSQLGVIQVTDWCNHACEHCCSATVDYGHKTFEELKEAIDRFDPKSTSVISFFGKEASLHPQIIPAMQYAKTKGYLSQISSNGQLIGDTTPLDDEGLLTAGQDFTNRLVNSGLVAATISVHTTDEQLNNDITGVSSYEAIWSAIENLYNRGVFVITQSVMTKRILPTLLDTLDEIQNRCPGILMALSACLPYGGGENIDLVPSFEEVQRHLYPIMERWGHVITVEHIPDCFIQPYDQQIINQDIFLLEGSGFHFAPKPKECQDCVHNITCPGILERYMEMYPDTTVTPVRDRA